MNKWIGMGRIVRDPKLESSGNGVEYCRFTVAIDRAYTKKDGDKQTDFIDCTSFGKQAAFVQKYFHKGDGIMVDGRLESDKYVDKDGNNRVSWKIMCDRVEFPPSRKTDSGAAPSGSDFVDPNDDDGDCPF